MICISIQQNSSRARVNKLLFLYAPWAKDGFYVFKRVVCGPQIPLQERFVGPCSKITHRIAYLTSETSSDKGGSLFQRKSVYLQA